MDKMTRKVALSLAISALSDNAEAVEVLTKMMTSIERKSSAPRKSAPTARQIENEGIKTQILSLLGEGQLTIPMLMDGIEVANGEELTCQRVTALLTQLKNDGLVVRNEGKTATFSLCAVEVGE